MVNTSIAERMLEELRDKEGNWIIVYDFVQYKPNPNFWINLNRISAELGGYRVQYSVYITGNLREAIAVKNLVHHYGGDALVYRCTEFNL